LVVSAQRTLLQCLKQLPLTKISNLAQEYRSMYIVMESSAHMPSSCKAPYRRIAVVQLSQEYTAHNRLPKFIGERARGVLRIAREYAPVPAKGKTERCGLVQTRKAAADLAYRLNNATDMASAEQIIGAGGSA
jgi:hypothetical protein